MGYYNDPSEAILRGLTMGYLEKELRVQVFTWNFPFYGRTYIANARRALDVAEQVNDLWFQTFVRSCMLYMAYMGGADRAFCDTTLAQARACGDRWLIVLILAKVGEYVSNSGDLATAAALHAEMANMEAQINPWGLTFFSNEALGQDAIICGDLAQGYALYEHAIESLQARSHTAMADRVRLILLFLDWAMGDLQRAAEYLEGLAPRLLQIDKNITNDIYQLRVLLAIEQGNLSMAYSDTERWLAAALADDNYWHIGWSYRSQGIIHLAGGEVIEAVIKLKNALNLGQLYPQALVIAPLALYKLDLPLIHAQLALAAAYAGDAAEARVHLASAETAPGTYMVFWRAEEQLTRAAVLIQLGAWEDAWPHVLAGLRQFVRCGSRHRVAWGLELAAALVAPTDPACAVRWWAVAAATRTACGAPIWPVERPYYEQRLAAARMALGDAAFQAAWEVGAAMGWEQTAQEVLTNANVMPPEARGHAQFRYLGSTAI